MKGWKSFPLGDAPIEIIDGDRGKNYPSEGELLDNGYCLFLSTKNVREHGFDFSSCQFITNEKDNLLRKGKLRINDLVLTTRGTVGNIALYDNSIKYNHVRINSGMVIVRPIIEKVDPKYIFYTFKLLQREWPLVISGSAQPQLPIKDIKNVEISIPKIDEQRAIAAVLSSLDDKIDLLHRQNATLEAMAEALFRKVFIIEAKDEWKTGELSDICECITEKFYPNIVDYSTKYIGLEHIDKKIIYLSRFGASTEINSTKFKFHRGDILFGKLRPYFHKVCFAPFDGVCSTDILVIRPKKEGLFLFSLFAFYQCEVVEFATYCSNGTRMPRIDWNTLKTFEISLPDKESLDKFNRMCAHWIDKIEYNRTQIQTLEKLRDTLLPKLMSGEVRVDY